MSLSVGTLVGTLKLEDKGFTRGVDDAKTKLGGLGDTGVQTSERMGVSWKQMATGIGGALAAVGVAQFAKASIGAAASLEQAVGGTAAVFGEASGAVEEYASHSATSLGLSERAFRDLTTVAGAQLKNLGFSVEEAADKSIQLTEIGADLAATYGGTTAEAVEALGAAFRGEADPAERFGLSLNITAANAKAVEMGLAASTSEVSSAAKAQAVLALIMEQSADAQGQFGREADTAAGQAARLSAQFEDMQAELGAKLLPVLTEVGKALSGVVGNDAALAAVGIGTVGAASLLALPKIISIKDAVKALDINFATAGKNLAKGGAIAAGVSAVVVAVHALADALPEVDGANLGRLEASLSEITSGGRLTGEALDSLGEDFSELDSAIGRVSAPGTADRAVDALASIGTIGGSTSMELKEAQQTVDDFDKALTSLAQNDPAKAFAVLEAAAEATGRPVEELLPLLDDYDTQLGEVEAAASLAGEDVDEFGVASGEAAEEVESLTDAIAGLLESFFSVQEASIAQNDAIAGVSEHLKEMREEYGSGAMSLDVNTEAGRRNQEMLQGLFEETGNVIQAMVDSGSTSEELRTQWAADRGELSAVIERFRAAGIDVSRYDALLAEVDRLVATEVNANDNASPTIMTVAQRLFNLDGSSATVTINEVLRRNTLGLFNPDGRALGGPVRPDNVYEVTEGGIPELLHEGGKTYLLPGMGGHVETIGQAMARAGGSVSSGPAMFAGGMGSGGGAPAQLLITFDAAGIDSTLATWFRKTVRVEGRGDVQVAFGAG